MRVGVGWPGWRCGGGSGGMWIVSWGGDSDWSSCSASAYGWANLIIITMIKEITIAPI